MNIDKTNNEALLALIIEGIENVKGDNITILDLRAIDNTACDYFVICDGNSNTQVNAISGSIQRAVSKELKDKPWHVEGSRSEEHTSELQSRPHLVCRLLLEKKKTLIYCIEWR